MGYFLSLVRHTIFYYDSLFLLRFAFDHAKAKSKIWLCERLEHRIHWKLYSGIALMGNAVWKKILLSTVRVL